MKKRGISLWQPHADLIAFGHKTIETRRWYTPYRGPIVICASKRSKLNAIDIDEAIEAYILDFEDILRDRPLLPEGYTPRYGVAVAEAELFDCRKLNDTKYDIYHSCVGSPKGLFGFCLRKVRSVEPYPVSGKPGIFEIEVSAINHPPPREEQLSFLNHDTGEEK